MTSITTESGAPGGKAVVGPPNVLHRDLEPDAIGLLGATMQAITHISPAIAAFFYTAVVVGYAGVTAPLAYFLGFLLVLMLGNTLIQFSKHLPSAGSYYTYVSRAIHPRAGFMTSWMYIFYSPLCGGAIYGFFGFILAGELKTNWNIDVPWLWAACILVGAPFVAFIQHRGIKLSTEFMVVTGGLEMLVVFALGLSGILSPGPGGISAAPFNPVNIGSAANTFGGGSYRSATIVGAGSAWTNNGWLTLGTNAAIVVTNGACMYAGIDGTSTAGLTTKGAGTVPAAITGSYAASNCRPLPSGQAGSSAGQWRDHCRASLSGSSSVVAAVRPASCRQVGQSSARAGPVASRGRRNAVAVSQAA
jgi:amino acid transporter